MSQIKLKDHIWLVKIDKRSGRTFEHFTHRIDMVHADAAIEFLAWLQDNIGHGVSWNLYLYKRDKADFKLPKWAVRYQEPGSCITEVFVHPDYIPYIMLMWAKDATRA